MNEIKPTVGFEIEDKYTEAMRKMLDFKQAFDALSPDEKERFVKEVAKATGVEIFFEQFVRFMSNGGQG